MKKKNAINREMEFILEDLRIEVYLTINNNASCVDFFFFNCKNESLR